MGEQTGGTARNGDAPPRGWRDRGTAIGEGLSWLSRWSLRVALVALGGYLLWQLVAALWVVVLPVLLALLLATVMWPPTAWLRDRGLRPAAAASLVMIGSLVVLGVLVALLTVSIAGGVPQIAENASRGIGQIREWLAGPPLNLAQSQLDAAISQATERIQSSIGSIASGLVVGVGAVTSGIITMLLALVLVFLFVKDGPRFLPWMRSLVGERAGGHVTVVLSRIWTTLGGFIRTQAIVSLIDAVLIGIGLVIVGVPLALPLAVLTFLGGFIPIVGALVAGALAVLVALVSNGFTAALIVLGIVVLVQQIEGNVLQPILQSRTMRLHAAVVLLAVTAGGSLFGIGGAFLAVPVVAAAAVVLRYLGEMVDRRAADVPLAPPADQATSGEPIGQQGDAPVSGADGRP